jgi:hypothetical protein
MQVYVIKQILDSDKKNHTIPKKIDHHAFFDFRSEKKLTNNVHACLRTLEAQ